MEWKTKIFLVTYKLCAMKIENGAVIMDDGNMWIYAGDLVYGFSWIRKNKVESELNDRFSIHKVIWRWNINLKFELFHNIIVYLYFDGFYSLCVDY